eukprot:CAMPEP_0194374170 /NCGR_PEP_ID=MMETSP0174-20130528/22546_1 /TAXON_ID=216777 /ORGANISM="Proboscia alata, Strain PI-D3" /LENGTH=1500 /DNA_ID=CAMNT_0039153563 /DNA_START=236 /DNA_END=4738 /DNA_ORIENTATION=+
MAEHVEVSFDGAQGSLVAPLPGKSSNLLHRYMNPYNAPSNNDEEDASFPPIKKPVNGVNGDNHTKLNELNESAILPVLDHAHLVSTPESFFVDDNDSNHATSIEDNFLEESVRVDKDSESSSSETYTTSPPRSIINAGLESFKYVVSILLLVFSLTLVTSTIYTGQTTAIQRDSFNPVATYVLFWLLLIFLAIMEGGLGCLVGLQPIDRTCYSTSHPVTLKSTVLGHEGNNMERVIVGRQFLIVLAVFFINWLGAPVPNAEVLGLSGILKAIFLDSGLAVILTTIILGQLTSQINAAQCMLDFLNSHFMLYFVTYLSLAVEFSGLLHSVYLVQILFSKITGKAVEGNEASRGTIGQIFFWIRALFSLSVVSFGFALTFQALFEKQTTIWEWGYIPSSISMVLLFALFVFVGMMEGMQIALFTVVNLPEEELARYSIAYRNCQLVFRGENLQAYLIGRQLCTSTGMFLLARMMTLNYSAESNDNNIWGVSNGLQFFFNTGIMGAVVTTVVASLIWRIAASTFPLAFLSNPLVYIFIRFCLLIEFLGVGSSSWVLARIHKCVSGFQPDEVYLCNAEPHTSAPVTRRDKDIDRTATILKYFSSLSLLVFCIIMLTEAIFTEQKNGALSSSYNIPPAVTFCLFWFLLIWLSVMEGGQGCLIGLRPIDKFMYAESHLLTLRNTTVAHMGDNMERFIVGRQFLVVLVIFAMNKIVGSFTTSEDDIFGLPSIVKNVFLSSGGLAMIVITVVIGQLTSQINAANCMLDFINNRIMLYFVTHVSLAVEWSGLLHAVYAIQMLFSKITGKITTQEEEISGPRSKVFFWVRATFSMLVLIFASVVTIAALFSNKTTMWEGVSGGVSVSILISLMLIVGIMEGAQSALFAVVHMREEDLARNAIAYYNCQLAFSGQNLQSFLIGRQICITSAMFVFARIMTLKEIDSNDDTVLGVPLGVIQVLFSTGLLGTVITTILASLMWRIIASSFPLVFLSNPLMYLIIRLCLFLDGVGVCSSAWVLARFLKPMVGYQPDEVHLEGAAQHTAAPATKRDKDIDITITIMRYVYSSVLLGFSIVVVMAVIFERKTILSQEVHPLFASFSFWFFVFWLAIMEGGQGCLVGLQPVDKDIYAESHPVTLLNTRKAHSGDNMERFIVGRQFLVVLVFTMINMCGSAVEGTQISFLGNSMNGIFVGSGLGMILTTIVVGQLTSQVNAANCMLDFINSYFMLATTYLSLFVEYTGLLHSVYLIQLIFARLAGKPIDTNEPQRNIPQTVFFWIRVFFSLLVLGYALVITLTALFESKTKMWDGVPGAVSIIILIILCCFVGMMEGMQIAFFTVVNLPEEELVKHKTVYQNCQTVFSGPNLQSFLIGRQICAASGMFVVARIMTLNYSEQDDNVLGVSDALQTFFNTGLLGAVITTILASLVWRVIASSFPIAFLSNPFIGPMIKLCLFFESTGVCSSVWLLALTQKKIAGYQVDELYIGTPDERCADEEEGFEIGADADGNVIIGY